MRSSGASKRSSCGSGSSPGADPPLASRPSEGADENPLRGRYPAQSPRASFSALARHWTAENRFHRDEDGNWQPALRRRDLKAARALPE